MDLVEYDDEEEQTRLSGDELMTESDDDGDARKHDEVAARGETEIFI